MGSSNTRFEQVPLSEIHAQIARGEILEETMGTYDNGELHSGGEPDFDYPQWQKLLHAALLELDKERLKERVELAESAIADRMRSMAQDGGGGDRVERQALVDALTSLRILKKDRF